MTTYPERQKYVMWINEAIKSGARKLQACKIVGLSIRTLQRWVSGDQVLEDKRPTAKRPIPVNKLTQDEVTQILDVCMSPEFADMPPSKIVPTLADRGAYIASESSFYRVLKAHGLTQHRGRQKQRGTYKRPTTFTASKPNQLWTWDITHIPSTVIGKSFYLYMFVDIFSRKIVGAEVYEQETGKQAAELLQRAVLSEKCSRGDLVLHSDNGAPMKSFTMQAKMYDLGIQGSHSRPRVSNDNPYSESLFRTLKYCPQWPRRGFSDIDKARKWVQKFVDWYNNRHKHCAIKFVTPSQKHSLEDIAILERRGLLYEKKKKKHPHRWSRATRNWKPVVDVALNPERQNKKAA